jgi:hypothetical protein
MDPATIIATIASSLGIVDTFVDIVRKLRSEPGVQHRVEARKEGDEIVIIRDGQTVERVNSKKIKLNQWDETRFNALSQRVSVLWGQFNGLYAQLPILSVDEQIRIKARMEGMRKELCTDFKEMVSISEKVLNIPLEDHYTLYDTCREKIS